MCFCYCICLCFFVMGLGKRVWTRGYSGSGYGNPPSGPAGKRDGYGTLLGKRVRVWYHLYRPEPDLLTGLGSSDLCEETKDTASFPQAFERLENTTKAVIVSKLR